ncbi:hypothetical protein [Methylobacterium sp. SD21]|uniref:hypothetical protein n=1 Tax=Methylobacterium litchii TaxID=3138810 RepID=UPI00313D53E4
MLPPVQITDLLGLGCLILALAVAGLAGVGAGRRLTEDSREYLAGGALLVAILGLVFVFAE